MRRQGVLTEHTEDYYVMSAADVERSIRESAGTQLYRIGVPGSISNVTVVCDPNYVHELMAYYHWGERHASNYLEDVSRISGQVFRTDKELVIVPRFLLRIVSESRTKTSVKANIDNSRGAEYQNDIFDECLSSTDYDWLQRFGPLHVIGHCHSHPELGTIGVHPSSIDVKDHLDSISDGRLIWLSQIVDPIRRMSAFYFGGKLGEPNVVFYLYPSDVNLFRTGKPFQRKAPATVPEHVHKVIEKNDPHAETPADEPHDPVPDIGQNEEIPEEKASDDTKPAEKVKAKRSKSDRRKKKAIKMKTKKIIRQCLLSNAYLEQIAQIVMNNPVK